MLNVLIIYNDIIETVNLINYLSPSIPEIRIYNILSCGYRAVDIIKSVKPDLILLGSSLLDIPGIDFFNYLNDNNFTNYLDSIILLMSSNDTNLLNISNNPYIFSSHFYSDYKNIAKSIKSFISKKSNNSTIENKLFLELSKLKFNFSHIGTKYLIDSILYIYSNNLDNFILKNDVYPFVANKYHTNINTVKCDILQASSYAYYECDEDIFSNYFRIFPINKPSTKHIISTIIDKLHAC